MVWDSPPSGVSQALKLYSCLAGAQIPDLMEVEASVAPANQGKSHQTVARMCTGPRLPKIRAAVLPPVPECSLATGGVSWSKCCAMHVTQGDCFPGPPCPCQYSLLQRWCDPKEVPGGIDAALLEVAILLVCSLLWGQAV